MAQLDFYLSAEDKMELMSFIFSEGGYIIPDLNYEKPSYLLIRDVESYRSFVNQNILFFMAHDSYFKEPLTLRTINKEGKDIFYIPQRNGGPTIDFYSPGFIEKMGTHFIGQGNISHYSTYHGATKNNIEIPDELKQFYKKICNQIKKNSFAIKLSKRTYWIGSKAIESLRNGSKLINVPDDILTGFLEFAHS